MLNDFTTGLETFGNWTIRNIFYINIVLSIIIVFFQRRDPKAVWTWLLVLYFIPILGFVLYLVLGQDFHKTKMFRIKEIEDVLNSEIKRQEDNIANEEFLISDANLSEYTDLLYYNLETSGSIYTNDNSVRIFTEGNDKFQDLIEEIKRAEEFIHIQYYIIRDDDLFKRIEEALSQKAEEGVEVRILYDGMGGNGLKKKTVRRLEGQGFKVGVFFPAFLKRLHLRINYRNHRKIVIIDGKIGYVGGFNIGNEYLGIKKKYGHWRDTHIKIRGSAVNDLQIRFILDWNYAAKENLVTNKKYYKHKLEEAPGDIGMQVVSSGPDSRRKEIRDNYLRLICKAKKNIYIQTPYFIPDDAVLDTLKIAAMSGVEVKVMIPNKPDHPFVYWATYSYIGDLLSSGAHCYLYNDGFLHAKGIMVDGLASSYGTANMDIRSFELNFEVNVVIYDSKTTKILENIFIQDLKLCRELTKYDYDKRSLGIRIKEQVSRLLSPLM